MYGSGFTVVGDPGTTREFTLTNSGQSLEALFGGSYKVNNQEPIAFTVSIETQEARIGFGAVSADGVGHLLQVKGSGRWANLGAVQKALLVNAAAGVNAVAHITLEY